MPRTHVWLLDRGGPDADTAVRPWLDRVARDDHASPVPDWMRWFVWVWVWWSLRRVAPACKQLSGPVPQLDAAREQAHRLSARLGRRYDAHAVFRHWGGGVDAALAALPKGAQVVLLPLTPGAHPDAHTGALKECWRQLHRAGHTATAVDPWHTDARLVHLLARRVRAARLELSDAASVAVIFHATAPPKLTGVGASAWLEATAELATEVRAATGLRGPALQGWSPPLSGGSLPGPSLQDALQSAQAKGAEGVVIVPLGPTTPWPELAAAHTCALPTAVAQPLAPSDELTALLAELTRSAERAAGWEVPEDVVHKAVLKHFAESGIPTVGAVL